MQKRICLQEDPLLRQTELGIEMRTPVIGGRRDLKNAAHSACRVRVKCVRHTTLKLADLSPKQSNDVIGTYGRDASRTLAKTMITFAHSRKRNKGQHLMNSAKILRAGLLSILGFSASVAHAKSTTDQSNYRSRGAFFQYEAPTQCGTNEYGAPMFASFGIFISTQLVDFGGSNQTDVQSTAINLGYFNPCTNQSGFASGQTDFNPTNLVSIDNSAVATSLQTATFSATIPVVFGSYDGNTGVFSECSIQAQVSAVLQSTATPENSSFTTTETGPTYHVVYHSNGKRVDATGNFTVQLSASAGCSLAALPANVSAAAQGGTIVDSHDAFLQVTHNHGKR